MKPNKLYLHIGLHKTATTSFQMDTFPYIEGVEYVGRHHIAKKRQGYLYCAICRYCFSKKKPRDKQLKKIQAKIQSHLLQTSMLLSEEWFSSDYDGFFYGRGARWQEKIKRLTEIVSGLDCFVLVSVRDPSDAVFSLYTEFLRVGYADKFTSITDFIEKSNDVKPYFYPELSLFLCGFFSPDKIFFVRYEDLIEDSTNYMEMMGKFFGGKTIKSPTTRNVKRKKTSGILIEKQKMGLLRAILSRIPHSIRRFLQSLFPLFIVKRINRALSSHAVVSYPTGEEKMRASECLQESAIFLHTLNSGFNKKGVKLT